MEKKESSNAKNMKNSRFESKRVDNRENPKKHKDKSLPWWVELLFVQIGLPDKFLIRILKLNKNLKEFIKNDKKLIFSFLFAITFLGYLYPIVKQSKNNLECEKSAMKYISNNINLTNLSRKELKMLSVNFCNGGKDIYEIKN